MTDWKREQVVILCGGQGTRLREETEFRPKAMVHVGGRPILWHLMRTYYHWGYRRFILCLGYRGDMIKEYFLNYRWNDFDFQLDLRSGERRSLAEHGEVEDWEIVFANTGENAQTGARLKGAQRYVDTDTFLFNYCDGLSDINLEALVAQHQDKGKIATLTGFHPRSRYGVVRADDNQVVSYWQEKPMMTDRTSGGFFVMDKRIFGYLSDDPGCILETEALGTLAKDSELALYPHDGFWFSMDTYKEALALNAMWDEGNAPWAVWK